MEGKRSYCLSHAATGSAIYSEPLLEMQFASVEFDFARHVKAVFQNRSTADKDHDAVILFRLPIESDKPTIEQWIAADPDHSGMEPEFFFNENAMSLVLGDDRGPGIFVRVDPEAPESVRLHIQFSPNEVRSMKALLKGWEPFKQGIWNSGVKRMVFESHSKVLIGFCKRVFGFTQVTGTHDYELRVA